MTAQHLPETQMSSDRKTIHNELGWALTEGSRAGGLEYGLERGGEVRPAVAEQEPDVLEPPVEGEGEGEVAGLLHGE